MAMIKKYTKKIQITLEEKDYEAIREKAEREEIPVSIFMRKVVKRWLKDA